MKRQILFTSLLLLITLPVLAGKVYKIVDEDGNITYTDRAPNNQKDNETTKLPFINTQPAPKLQAREKSTESPRQEAKAFSAYKKLAIITPQDQQTITSGQRSVNVSIALTPALQPGHTVQIIFDGYPKGVPQTATDFTLTDLYRGEHQIFFRVLDANKATFAKSPAVTIYVQRPHVNNINAASEDKRHSDHMETGAPPQPDPAINSPFSLSRMMKQARQKED